MRHSVRTLAGRIRTASAQRPVAAVAGVAALAAVAVPSVLAAQHDPAASTRSAVTRPVTAVAVQPAKLVRPERVVTVDQSPAGAKAMAEQQLGARGWAGQWQCLDSLWTKESSWKFDADNPSSDAYGIPQALPGSKMATAGGDWRTNPATQIRWGLDYIAAAYGTPCGAWGHEVANGWY